MGSEKYRQAGVDTEKGAVFCKRIGSLASETQRPEVLSGVGGFSALCALPDGYKSPILVSATDGVGTKLRLAIDHNIHQGVGIDLVAMCVNDILTSGAEPLLFLDYLACAQLNLEQHSGIVEGIARGCKFAGCALVGGETAEMPGMYQGDDYDLAGFCVGVVERDNILGADRVCAGDSLIALASSGLHSNGFSLVRKLVETKHLSEQIDGKTVIETLLEPTRIYVASVREVLALPESGIHAMAHITGGGLLENLPRVLPSHLGASIDQNSWKQPAVFKWLQQLGEMDTDEMHKVFNCGVGMVLCVAAEQAQDTMAVLTRMGESVWQMGCVTEDPGQVVFS